jgi:hypothetical protein
VQAIPLVVAQVDEATSLLSPRCFDATGRIEAADVVLVDGPPKTCPPPSKLVVKDARSQTLVALLSSVLGKYLDASRDEPTDNHADEAEDRLRHSHKVPEDSDESEVGQNTGRDWPCRGGAAMKDPVSIHGMSSGGPIIVTPVDDGVVHLSVTTAGMYLDVRASTN